MLIYVNNHQKLINFQYLHLFYRIILSEYIVVIVIIIKFKNKKKLYYNVK